jgi:hypothetical protein
MSGWQMSESNRVNVILGLCEGYQAEAIKPFIDSLKKVNYSGEVVFFTRSRASSLINFFEENCIDVCSYGRARMGFMTEPVRASCNLIFSLNRSSKALRLQEKLAQFLWNVQASRYLHYRDYLYVHRAKYHWVMLTDVRDVIFQADPFSWDLPSGLHVFEEYPEVKLGEQEANRNWIDALYGKSELEQMQGYPIVCSGVTLGTVDAMLAYLDEMSNEIAKKTGPVGFDQGVHNYLVRKDRLSDVCLHEFNEGPVVHIGISPREIVCTREDGAVVDRDGKLVPVVHQYDRHEDLIACLT